MEVIYFMGESIEEIRRRGTKSLDRLKQVQAHIEEQHALDAEAKKVSIGKISGKVAKDISENPPTSASKVDKLFKSKV